MTHDREVELRAFFAAHCPAGLEALEALNDARYLAGRLRKMARITLERPPHYETSRALREAIDAVPSSWEV